MIKVVVPATTANCCVGFDCLGMALDWWSTFTFEPADQWLITGCPKEFSGPDNLVLQAFKTTCEKLKKECPSFHLHIDSSLPSSRGFGSSAMCIVAGIEGANAWFGSPLTKLDMLDIATRFEGHPDNVGPALMGNVSVSFMEGDQIYSTPMPCADWKLLAMVPDQEVPTAQARKVLPKSLSLDHTKKQVAYALSFMQALQTGDLTLLEASCHDFIHEPYRKHLISAYEPIHQYCQDHGIPMWISGSGSTMIAIHHASEPLAALQSFADGLHLFCKEVHISKKGAYVVYE